MCALMILRKMIGVNIKRRRLRPDVHFMSEVGTRACAVKVTGRKRAVSVRSPQASARNQP
jgi:hypothetical protein